MRDRRQIEAVCTISMIHTRQHLKTSPRPTLLIQSTIARFISQCGVFPSDLLLRSNSAAFVYQFSSPHSCSYHRLTTPVPVDL
jgi:hypothetical protein